MTGFWLIIALIALFIVWLRIDFVLGMRVQRKDAKKFKQETRYGDVHLLGNGKDFFESLFHDIQQATDHIHILFYIVKDDNIGSRLLEILEDKAKEGVQVRLLVDRIGSSLKKKSIEDLKKVGISFAYSHPPKLPYLFFTLNRRNHRKVTVIDGKIGYVGGYNIGDEYLGRDPKFGFWRDFHLRIAGDGAQDLQEQFLQDWMVATKEQLKEERYYPHLPKGKIALRILPTDGVFLEDTFLDLIRQAKHTITIGSPYFIPGKAIQGELMAASKRGVDVRLIVPKKGDHPLVKEAAFPYFKELLESGVDIYRFYRGFYHTKTIVIDDQVCDIGTANFDKRSFHINHEINCLIYDSEFIRGVVNEMDYDISISDRLTLKEWEKRSYLQRGKEKVATLLSGLL